jgi:hypothetical protein
MYKSQACSEMGHGSLGLTVTYGAMLVNAIIAEACPSPTGQRRQAWQEDSFKKTEQED